MKSQILDFEKEEIEEHFQQIANKHKAIITVCWNHEMHRVFTPQKIDQHPTLFEDLNVPMFTEKLEQGE